MNEDVLNLAIRTFLKEVGITSQREIEMCLRDAEASGRLAGRKTVDAKMVLTIEALGLRHEIDSRIELE